MATPEQPSPPSPPSEEPGARADQASEGDAAPGGRALGAWQALCTALGHDFQGGMYEAEQSRRRMLRAR